MDSLNDPWSQRDQYKRVSDEFDLVRMLKGALPDLSVAMVEVLIAHVELMSELWNSSAVAKGGSAALDAVRSRHRRAVESMRARCLRFFSREQ